MTFFCLCRTPLQARLGEEMRRRIDGETGQETDEQVSDEEAGRRHLGELRATKHGRVQTERAGNTRSTYVNDSSSTNEMACWALA